MMFFKKSRPRVTNTPVRYVNGQVETDGTAYEPYLHSGSDRDAAPLIPSSRNAKPPGKKTGLRRLCVFCSTISLAVSLAIIALSVETITALEKSKTARLLWSHNMMLPAWPLTGAPAIPTYVTLSAASATALLNMTLLLAVICGRDRIYSAGIANAFGMATHVLLAAWFAAALVANGLYQPNLRTWACTNGPIETSYKSNIVGLQQVCRDMFAVFIASLVVGSFEILNAVVVAFVLLSERRRARVKAAFPKTSSYKKLDPSAEEQDEVPMLEISRKAMQ